ncbi:MAG: hypothetical protein HC869_26590 [Rhodospirillales bacterium]|nr:hypothetical protein [Rhodospirillales bacterium]
MRLSNATVMSFRNCNLRDTNASLIKLETQAIMISLDNCVLESFGAYALNLGAFCSLIRLSSIQVNANSKAGTAVVGFTNSIGAAQVSLRNVNVNGNNLLGNLIQVANGSSADSVGIRECYCELMAGSCIVATGTGLLNGLVVENCQLSGNNSVMIDLGNGALHRDAVIRNVRNGAALSSYYMFHPGNAVNFEFENASYNAGFGIVGYGAARSVKKYAAGTTIVDGV